VRVRKVLAVAVAVSFLAGCGEQGGDSGATGHRAGIAGRVELGPQCPVQTENHPCADKPAAGSTVTIAKQVAGGSETEGEVVARTTTNGDGSYRVGVAPGRYVVTTDAGMLCQPMVARVSAGAYSKVDFRCDTGIR
jgi:hypothetical protein